MKRIFLLAAAIFLTKLIAAGQTPEFGVRGGLNIYNLHGESWKGISGLIDPDNDITSVEDRSGFNLGAYGSLPLSHAVAVESGIMYEQKGVGFRISPLEGSWLNPAVKGTLKLDYLTVPLNITVKTFGGLKLTGGGSVSRLLDSRMHIRGSIFGLGLGDSFRINNTFNDWDVSLSAGLMYEFENGFHLKTAYQRGLLRVYDNLLDLNAFNGGFSFSAGYRF